MNIQIPDIAIATMTLARDHQESELLRRSTRRLSECGIPVVVTDGGSDTVFTDYLTTLPNTTVISAPGVGLLAQIKNSLSRASRFDKEYILYTEPDKLWFFENRLRAFLSLVAADHDVGIGVAARDDESLSIFPRFQQLTESAMNDVMTSVTGTRADFCYGPMLIHRRLVDVVDLVRGDVGWGFRFVLLGIAHRLGMKIVPMTLQLPNHDDQEGAESDEMKVYRLQQLIQNLQGLALSLGMALPNGVQGRRS